MFCIKCTKSDCTDVSFQYNKLGPATTTTTAKITTRITTALLTTTQTNALRTATQTNITTNATTATLTTNVTTTDATLTKSNLIATNHITSIGVSHKPGYEIITVVASSIVLLVLY